MQRLQSMDVRVHTNSRGGDCIVDVLELSNRQSVQLSNIADLLQGYTERSINASVEIVQKVSMEPWPWGQFWMVSSDGLEKQSGSPKPIVSLRELKVTWHTWHEIPLFGVTLLQLFVSQVSLHVSCVEPPISTFEQLFVSRLNAEHPLKSCSDTCPLL